MSLQAITAALAVDDITSSEKFLLMVLANYADADLKCWPSQERLARDTRMTTRTILANLKSLELAGWLWREHRPRRGDGSRNSDMIHLQFHSEMVSPRPRRQREIDDVPYLKSTQNLPETISGKPSLEPPIEEPSVRSKARHCNSESYVAPSPEQQAASLRQANEAEAAERRAVGEQMRDLARSLSLGSAIPKPGRSS